MSRLTFGALERLFPYDVLKSTHELMMRRFEQDGSTADMPEYRFANPIWLFDHDERERKKLFANFRKSVARGKEFFPQMNEILDIEPFGEMVILDLAFDAARYDDFLDPQKRVGVPLALIAGQYYDENGEPQLKSGMTATEFAQVDRNDARLALVALEFTEVEPRASVLQVPDDMLDRWTEVGETAGDD